MPYNLSKTAALGTEAHSSRRDLIIRLNDSYKKISREGKTTATVRGAGSLET